MAKNEGETDWDYLKRQVPWAYEAFHRIPCIWEAMEALFDKRTTIWNGNDQTDLTNKTLLGLLHAEVEDLAGRVRRIEESLEGQGAEKGWRLLLRAKASLLYQSPVGEIVAIPLELADVLVNGLAFEGDVTAHGKYVRFTVGDDVLADIPRSLMLQLRGSGPGARDDGGEGNPGEGGGE